MDRRTLLATGAGAVAAALAGCGGSGAAVDETVFESARYEVDADAGETIRVEVAKHSGGRVGVTITDPTGSVAVSSYVRDDGALSHDAERRGTFGVAVETNDRTTVQVTVGD